MPARTSSVKCTGKGRSGSSGGTTSVAQVSLPTSTILRWAEPRRGSHADAGLAGGEGRVVFHPKLAVAGADEHHVAFTDVHALRLGGDLEIVGCDHITDLHSFDTARLRHVEQHSRMKNTPTFSMPSFSRP